MNVKEMRELDAWIAEHLFKQHIEWRKTLSERDPWIITQNSRGYTQSLVPNFTTDPAVAMLVLEKCAEKIKGCALSVETTGGRSWTIGGEFGEGMIYDFSTAETLPLAICKFAKQLYGKDKPLLTKKSGLRWRSWITGKSTTNSCPTTPPT